MNPIFRVVVVLMILLLFLLSGCNLPGYTPASWHTIVWTDGVVEPAATINFYPADSSNYASRVVQVGTTLELDLSGSSLECPITSLNLVVNGTVKGPVTPIRRNQLLFPDGYKEEDIAHGNMTFGSQGHYFLQTQAVRGCQPSTALSSSRFVCVWQSSPAECLGTPTPTATFTPLPTIEAPTPRPAHRNSNGTCSPPPQGCFPYSWIQAQCKCGVP